MNNILGHKDLSGNVTEAPLNCKIKKAICVFPFIYKNKRYSECIKLDHKKFWCTTTTNATDHHVGGKWGDCSPECPLQKVKVN